MQVPRGAEWESLSAASGAKTRRMQRKYREKFANRSCNAKIAVLQYARSITFPKASGKAGYIGKLPCGGFSKDCKLERTNRLRPRRWEHHINREQCRLISGGTAFCIFVKNKMFKLSFSFLGWRAIMTSFQGESEKRQPRGSIWDGPFAWKYQNALLQILVGGVRQRADLQHLRHRRHGDGEGLMARRRWLRSRRCGTLFTALAFLWASAAV